MGKSYTKGQREPIKRKDEQDKLSGYQNYVFNFFKGEESCSMGKKI